MTAEQALILIVDDDYDFLEINRFILEGAGYRVTTATNPAEALKRVDEEVPDLVITDLTMPEMNGLEFAREILALRPDIPFAIASGYVSDELRAKAKVE